MKRDKRSELQSLKRSHQKYYTTTFKELYGDELKIIRTCLNLMSMAIGLICSIGMFLEGYEDAFYIAVGFILLIAFNLWNLNEY